MAGVSTRKNLLSLIDDVEIISKFGAGKDIYRMYISVVRELLDIIATPKHQRTENIDTGQILELLIQKDKEIQEAHKTAEEQAQLKKRYDQLKAEVERRDTDITLLQQNLKKAESVLATAIYQAKQKLTSISQASQRKISSEDLIKYAHKISASNAVAAPSTWNPGDPRRPYPTDIDMRCGILSRLNDIGSSSSHQSVGSAQTLSEALGHSRTPSQLEQALNAPVPGQLSHPQAGSGSGPTFHWQSSVDSSHSGTTHSSHSPRTTIPAPITLETKPGIIEDVEIMSSDSSSSSSSDE